jgi:hypothetical protein
VTLTKVVTTVGKPGVQVASITKRPNGYAFAAPGIYHNTWGLSPAPPISSAQATLLAGLADTSRIRCSMLAKRVSCCSKRLSTSVRRFATRSIRSGCKLRALEM